MKNEKSDSTTSRVKAGKKSCCEVDIRIDQAGDVHIHNCSAPPEKPCGGDTSPPACPDAPIGSCIPVVAGAKHKLGRDFKLQQLAETARVPSAIATSIIHMARRFLLGKAPADAIEASAFALFEKISREILSCTLTAFDAMPARQRSRIFVESLLLDPEQAIGESTLVTALADELRQRAGVQVFGDPIGAEQERPGSIRVYVPGAEDFFSQVRICRVNGLRTANFFPPLALGDYLPSELQQDCGPQIVNGQPQVICEVRTTDCPGFLIQTAVCARVPEVGSGDGVTLEGVNYFSVDAKVRLTDKQTGTIVREVDAHVFGDVDTPVTEVVNGETKLINDCRVHDRISFQVPPDLGPGTYRVQVVVPNITGIPVFGAELTSNEEFIEVVPPPTARFQVVTERIIARKETSPDWLGSDEVGLHTLAFSLFADGTFSEAQEQKFKDIQDHEFDSGSVRDITRIVYSHTQPILAMALAIVGHEIDSQRAYNEEITSRKDFFVQLIKDQAKFIGAALTALGGLSALTKLGALGGWIAGIALAVTLAIDIIVALWAPADPIIRDSFSLTVIDLDILTSVDFPAPPGRTFLTEGAGDISVNVNGSIPPEKLPLQYRETREYVSGSEDSRYEITYRFNRTA